MRHIRGSAADLFAKTERELLLQKLAAAVGGRHDLSANHGEVGAWRKSLPVFLGLLCEFGFGHLEVLLEHNLPYSPKRVDAVLCGHHPESGETSYVLVELKQWSKATAVGDGLVKVAGVKQLQLHPVAQVRRYYRHLLDFTPALARRAEPVRAIAYLHNARRSDIGSLYTDNPEVEATLFAADQREELAARLRSLLDSSPPARPASVRAADDLLAAEKAPAKTLLKTAAAAFHEPRDDFVLLDEQQVALNLVVDAISKAEQAADNKTVIIVRGGPGSGKSAIATTLLAGLARHGKRGLHATGSKAFTETLRSRVASSDQRISNMFGYFNTVSGRKNELDVLVCDEAHRIRGGASDRRTLPEYERRQINSLIDAAKVPVFLLDEHQVVRPNERGTHNNIKTAAEARGYVVHTVELDGQFRCGGSKLFDEWVVRLLGLCDEKPIVWSDLVANTRDEYVVHATSDANALENWLLKTSSDLNESARISAGFCWGWTKPKHVDGKLALAADIDIPGWHRPWNTPSGESVPDAPPASLWASDPRGFGQVGCVYTAQGFEYDWAGVIFGEDLVFRKGQGWRPQQDKTKDPALQATSKTFFDKLVRNTYKVLLTRGMQGVCVHSVDPETNEFLRHFAR